MLLLLFKSMVMTCLSCWRFVGNDAGQRAAAARTPELYLKNATAHHYCRGLHTASYRTLKLIQVTAATAAYTSAPPQPYQPPHRREASTIHY